MVKAFFDLNLNVFFNRFSTVSRPSGAIDEYRANHIFSTFRSFSFLRIYQNCQKIQRRLQDSFIYLLQSVCDHGFRSIDVSRKPSRHRNLLAFISKKTLHVGILGTISRNTLANANNIRDSRIYCDLSMLLINTARSLYANEELKINIKEMIYAFDSTTIDLCLALFPWAKFRKRKAAIKLHTLLDLRGSIPAFIWITEGKVHDVKALDILVYEANAYYIFDRGYLDFARLYKITLALAFFVTRLKSNSKYRRVHSNPSDHVNGFISDQIIIFTEESASINPSVA